MSRRDRKVSAMRRLIPAAGVLAVLAYVMWQAWDGAGDEDRSTGGVRPVPPVESEQSNGRQDAQTPVPVKTEPPGVESPAPGRPAGDEAEQAHEIRADMRRAWDCYESPHCRLGEDQDPRAEYFEAGERIATGMRALIQQHRAHRISDVELAEAAHQVLAYDSGRARAVAIQALRQLPPTHEHLDALIHALDQHHDEKLFELAMPEFKRYAEQGYGAEVDAFLQSNLRSGAHFPARTIARELGPFLTADNIEAYQELARDLPPDSPRAKLLQKTLETYGERH